MNLQIVLYLLSILLSLSIGLILGYTLQRIKTAIIALERSVVTLSKRKADVLVEEKPKTFLADPDDIVARAKFERDEIRRSLNR